jgi:preprotein translocase subunit SecE
MKEAKLESNAIPKPGKLRAATGGGSSKGSGGGGASAVLSGFSEWPSRTKSFLGDVRAEMKRVTWPSFAQIRATTVVVLVTVALFGVYFWILDSIFTKAVGRLLRIGS